MEILIKILINSGHDIKTREYKRKNGDKILYITSINGEIFYTDEQKKAHQKIKELIGGLLNEQK